MLKKDTLGKANALTTKSKEEDFKCGECLHFTHSPHPSFKGVCKENGIKRFAIAPKCYTPDVTALSGNSDQIVQLSTLFASYTPRDKRILLALLRGEASKKNKLPFGTKVYVRAMGADYIGNYLSGIVIGTTSSGQIIVSGSPDQNSRGRSYQAFFDNADDLLTRSEWLKKRKALSAAGKLYDPSNKFVRKSSVHADMEPPTLDNAPAAWFDKREKQQKRGRNQELTFQIIG